MTTKIPRLVACIILSCRSLPLSLFSSQIWNMPARFVCSPQHPVADTEWCSSLLVIVHLLSTQLCCNSNSRFQRPFRESRSCGICTRYLSHLSLVLQRLRLIGKLHLWDPGRIHKEWGVALLPLIALNCNSGSLSNIAIMPFPNDEELMKTAAALVAQLQAIFGPHPGFRPG